MGRRKGAEGDNRRQFVPRLNLVDEQTASWGSQFVGNFLFTLVTFTSSSRPSLVKLGANDLLCAFGIHNGYSERS